MYVVNQQCFILKVLKDECFVSDYHNTTNSLIQIQKGLYLL